MSAVMSEIERFRYLIRSLVARVGGEEIVEDAFLVGERTALFGKSYPYVVSAIVHGNEVGGVASVNEVLENMLTGAVNFDVPVVFFLGNTKAASQNLRFIERDMNRSFNMDDLATHEARRTKELEVILKETAFYLDIHQTKKASDNAFFIFPFKKESFLFARAMLPRQSIVTHWGKPFSSEGMCSDEYVNAHGGTGLTIELGQNGFDPYHVAIGYQSIIGGYQHVRDLLGGGEAALFKSSRVAELGEVYTWADIVPFPAAGKVQLDEGWHNFKPILKGQKMGAHDSFDLLASSDGYMMFPNYTEVSENQTLARPSELYRIMRKISESDLPAANDP